VYVFLSVTALRLATFIRLARHGQLGIDGRGGVLIIGFESLSTLAAVYGVAAKGMRIITILSSAVVLLL
jgi:hypothetical protein